MSALDPLLDSGPGSQRELFTRFASTATGFSTEAVMGAAANLLVNAIRQAYPTREKAAAAYDELVSKVKGQLIDQHYDATGRKKGLFPYNQVIEVPHFDFRGMNGFHGRK